MQSAISIRNLTKCFASSTNPGDKCIAVNDVTLDVEENEFLTMVGPSGCGKSTILILISGLEEPTSGEIFIGGQNAQRIPPRARDIGFMFQGYALFKHMTVADNVGFGLKIKKIPKKERQQRIEEMVSLVGLEGLEDRKPHQLSGGQQQRVALARAVAPRPLLLLLDEPFGAVDAKVRQKLRADTKKLQQELKITTILVTHDQREALELGDRVVVMNEGRIEQVDTPRNIYDYPATEFVARFIGRANVWVTELDGNYGRLMRGTYVEVIARPEDVSIDRCDEGQDLAQGRMVGTITSYAFLGRTVRLEVQLRNGNLVTVAVPKREALAKRLNPGKLVTLAVGSCQTFTL